MVQIKGKHEKKRSSIGKCEVAGCMKSGKRIFVGKIMLVCKTHNGRFNNYKAMAVMSDELKLEVERDFAPVLKKMAEDQGKQKPKCNQLGCERKAFSTKGMCWTCNAAKNKTKQAESKLPLVRRNNFTRVRTPLTRSAFKSSNQVNATTEKTELNP